MIVKKGKTGDIKVCAKELVNEFGGNNNLAKKYLKSKIKSSEFYVAEDNGKIVGFFTYARAYSHEANYWENVVVSEEYRNRGIARKLCEKFIEISKKETPRKQKYALSSTNANNKISFTMHKRLGFEKLGTIDKLHYGNKEIFFGYKL